MQLLLNVVGIDYILIEGKTKYEPNITFKYVEEKK